MKNINFKKALITALLTMTSIFLVNAQLYYQNNNLFIGTKPANPSSYSNSPKVIFGLTWGIEATSNDLSFWQNSTATKRLYIDSNGKVGIGKIPTTYSLEVIGQVSANGVVLTSDEILKRNITNLSDPRYNYMAKLLKLNGKSYEKQISSSDEGGYKQEFGFIAQEMREVLPELVEEGADGLLSINYIGLIPLLVESFKELKQDLAELENRVNNAVKARSSGGETDNEFIPVPGAVLHQSLPNPSSIGVTIAYELPENFSSANLYVYNIAGAQVKNFTLSRSPNEVKIAAHELPAGTYIYTLVINGNKVDSKRMILN